MIQNFIRNISKDIYKTNWETTNETFLNVSQLRNI